MGCTVRLGPSLFKSKMVLTIEPATVTAEEAAAIATDIWLMA